MTFFLTIFLNLFSQDNIAGRYRNYFGSRLQLNTDNTFKYDWGFDLSWSWTKGTWRLIGDTVYFTVIYVYDTLAIKRGNGTTIDTLILSDNETTERIATNNYIGLTQPPFPPWGQNYKPAPNKLVYKRGRFYELKNGRLVKNKQTNYWTKKSFDPWYFKDDS